MSISADSERNDGGGTHSFRKEECGKLSRHLLPFVWLTKCCDDVTVYFSELKKVMVFEQKLVDERFFDGFIVDSKENLKRSWNEHTNAQLRYLYQLFENRNPRQVGGSLDGIDIYHRCIPLIGPKRIGGSMDVKFSSVFSMQSW